MQNRAETAMQIAQAAGPLALEYFRRIDRLTIDRKGHLDFVTEADRQVELKIRADLAAAFPTDGIVGEEHAPKIGSSGFRWVIDPIDGTANFVAGIPFWCIVIAGVQHARIETAAIYDPIHDESFVAARGQGARLNDRTLQLAQTGWGDGTTAIGSSRRAKPAQVAKLVQNIVEAGGIFARTGSGALSLAYVAAGRYIGYAENHMNAWDCLAGQLLVAEAGGQIEPQNADDMIENGGRVIAAAPGIFTPLLSCATQAFQD